MDIGWYCWQWASSWILWNDLILQIKHLTFFGCELTIFGNLSVFWCILIMHWGVLFVAGSACKGYLIESELTQGGIWCSKPHRTPLNAEQELNKVTLRSVFFMNKVIMYQIGHINASNYLPIIVAENFYFIIAVISMQHRASGTATIGLIIYQVIMTLFRLCLLSNLMQLITSA